MLDAEQEKKLLPLWCVRCSKIVVGLAALCMAIGTLGILGLGGADIFHAVLFTGMGLAVLSTAGYYWGCKNEGCT
jgi:hypothetical protein